MNGKWRAFSCGTDFVDWQESNCDNCKNQDFDNPDKTCSIEREINIAYWDDGMVDTEKLKKAGWTEACRPPAKCNDKEQK